MIIFSDNEVRFIARLILRDTVEIKAQILPLTKPKIVAWGATYQECTYVMIARIKYNFMIL